MLFHSLLDIVVVVGGVIGGAAFYVQNRKLSASVDVLDELIDTAESGKVLFSRDGQFQKASARAMHYIPMLRSLPHKEITRPDFIDYLYDNAVDLDGVSRSALDSLYSKGDYDFREVVYLPDGGMCLVRANTLASGHSVFLLTDVSVMQQREARVLDLGKENHRLTQAVAAVNSGIMICDPKVSGNPVIFVNGALCLFLGCTQEELLGDDWAPLLRMIKDSDERRKFIDALDAWQESEFEASRKSGDVTRWFSVRLTPVYDRYGRVDLLVLVLNETTKLKQREAEFFQAQKLDALGQLSAGIAHDFNNILSIIDGFSTMIGGLSEGNGRVLDYVHRIRTASKRGAGLTRKMLTFSRHKVVSREVVDLREVLMEQEGLLIPVVGATIRLNFYKPDEPVAVKCTSDSISHIVMNLVINSRDAMPEGGTIDVELFLPEHKIVPASVREKMGDVEMACLRVSDSGTGMDEQTVRRIFDPFFTTKEQGKGTGLGMSVVYGLVNEVGGVIDVVSHPGEGTQISIYMPLSNVAVTRHAVGKEDDLRTICLDGYTALVAEDEPDLRLLVSQILQGLGMHVLEAENGADALCVQDDYEGEIDILLTDVVMPEFNGVKLAELFTAVRPETKVIFMSGYPANGDMAPVSLPRGACFVAKPVRYEDLARLLLQRLREGDVARSEALLNEAMPQWTSVGKEKDEESYAVK